MIGTNDIIVISIVAMSWGLAWTGVVAALHNKYNDIPEYIRGAYAPKATGCSILANYCTSMINSVIAFVAITIGTFQAKQMEYPLLFKGPIIPYTRSFYLIFIGYCLYDFTWISLGDKSDIVMMGHHCLYLATTFLLLHSELFPILAMTLMCQELSSPFVHVMTLMIECGLNRTRTYTINGILLALTFFIFRVCFPLAVFILIAKQWSLVSHTHGYAIAILTLAFLGYILQLYWFSKIAKGAYKVLLGRNGSKCVNVNGEDDKLLNINETPNIEESGAIVRKKTVKTLSIETAEVVE